MSELKACPFCDGKGERLEICGVEKAETDESQLYIRCKSCACEGGWAKSKAGAIFNWNLRPIEDTLNNRIAELEEIIASHGVNPEQRTDHKHVKPKDYGNCWSCKYEEIRLEEQPCSACYLGEERWQPKDGEQ